MSRGGDKDAKTGKYKTREVCNKRQMDIIYSLVYEDLKVGEMLKRYKVPARTYYDWFEKEYFVNRLREEREKCFAAKSGDAIKKLCQLMHCGDKRTELKAAQLILQENGHLLGSISRESEKTTEIHITLEDNRE